MSTLESSARGRAAFHTLRVRSVEALCDDAVAVTFEVPAELGEAYDFLPGQSLTLRRTIEGREERRTYSICAPAGAAPRVGVRVVPDGLFSRWLVHDVRPGDEVQVQAPTGSFVVDPALGGRHVLIAAGSGITPVLSIIGTVLRHPQAQVTLLYANRTTQSVMFAEEIADLKDRYHERLDLIHVLSREPRDVELLSGRLDAERLRRVLTSLVPLSGLDHVWLCGPFELITSAREVLDDLGVERSRLHTELFFVDEPPPELHRVEMPATAPGESAQVTLVLNGVRSTASVPYDTAVLDGAMLTRADLPFACKGGVCGTCRAKVTEGEVEMRRNYALDDDEVERGFVLTCQALPVSDRIMVDYDA